MAEGKPVISFFVPLYGTRRDFDSTFFRPRRTFVQPSAEENAVFIEIRMWRLRQGCFSRKPSKSRITHEKRWQRKNLSSPFLFRGARPRGGEPAQRAARSAAKPPFVFSAPALLVCRAPTHGSSPPRLHGRCRTENSLCFSVLRLPSANLLLLPARILHFSTKYAILSFADIFHLFCRAVFAADWSFLC